MVQRLLIIGLDGYEARIAHHLMEDGRMPHLAALEARAARVKLDHGPHKRTGLAWRHFSTGMAPDQSGVWSAVTFDPKAHQARQLAGTAPPFFASIGKRAVVLDAPYFDLRKIEDVRGFVNWGAHDPGVEAFSRPNDLLAEINTRFGAYPAGDDIYAFVWPSAEKTRATGQRLARALDIRADITHWLLSERMADWDVALTVVSELHSAIEPLWHGFDETHPLHALPSAAPAREGLLGVYEALDRMIGRMVDAFPDAAVMLFSMHGMGHNDADVPSMLLLPEFMYRLQFDKVLFETPERWMNAKGGVPMLKPNERWEAPILEALRKGGTLKDRAARKISRKLEHMSRPVEDEGVEDRADFGLDWMPSAFYAPYWKKMRAFALPSYYDGRIRLNVKGRESNGLIDPVEYEAEIARIERELLQVTDTRTGEPVVGDLIRTSPGDPMAVPETDGDLVVIWRGAALGFRHPHMNAIGPVPFRRTGGHTGGHGDFLLVGDDVAPGDYGEASAFDVAPTIEDLMGLNHRLARSGTSLTPRFTSRTIT